MLTELAGMHTFLAPAIREVDCVYSRDTEIEFFRTDENEETLVLKHEVIGNQATESKTTPEHMDLYFP
jgi:hypothetical protein